MILTLIERTQCWIQTDLSFPRCLPRFCPPTLWMVTWIGCTWQNAICVLTNLLFDAQAKLQNTKQHQNTNLPIVTKLNLISRSRSLWQFEIDIWGGKLLDARKAQLWFFDMNLFWGCFEYHKAVLLSTGTFQFGIVFIWKGLKSETPHEHC